MSHDERRLQDWRDSTNARLAHWPDRLLVSTCAIILDEAGEQVLVHQRSDNGWWGFPGGAVECGESVEQGLVREVREETGLVVTPDRLVGIYSDPAAYGCNQYPDGHIIHYCCVCVLCRVAPGDSRLRCSAESLRLKWVRWTALPGPFLPAHRRRLHDTLRSMSPLGAVLA
jgi:8-oxo-dGTP pyrophosphatase MutT (NUDIX family)